MHSSGWEGRPVDVTERVRRDGLQTGSAPWRRKDGGYYSRYEYRPEIT